MTERELLEELKQYDTPSVTNVLATYSHDKRLCLGLYNPWEVNWYTSQELRCAYPELGPTVGIAITCIVGLPSAAPQYNCVSYTDVLRAIHACDLPAIVVVQQDLPSGQKEKSGFSGGLLTTQWKKCGAIGCITNGPSRDLDEVRSMKFQYMLTGVAPGHGPYAMKAVNVPVSVCGMDVAPGEVIHMDENGAVKFPRSYLSQVVDRLKKLRRVEERRVALFKDAASIEEMEAIAAGKYDLLE